MSQKSLIETLGSWEAVCRHLQKQSNEEKNEDYYNWLLSLKDLSPSGYKKGLFFDHNFYHFLYNVKKKVNETTQQHVLVFTGKTGKGKSTMASQAAACLCPTLSFNDVCYIPSQFFKRMAYAKRGDIIWIDEGDRFFARYVGKTKLGQHLAEVLGTIRSTGVILIICFSKYNKLIDVVSEDFVDTIILKKIDEKANGINKYRNYTCFVSKAVALINAFIKKTKKTIEEVRVKDYNWNGHNSSEIPTINDFNEKKYFENKEKYKKTRYLELSKYYEQEEKKNEENSDINIENE